VLTLYILHFLDYDLTTYISILLFDRISNQVTKSLGKRSIVTVQTGCTAPP
jgi:hypothetical protein